MGESRVFYPGKGFRESEEPKTGKLLQIWNETGGLELEERREHRYLKLTFLF